uniref:Protein LNK2 n=1 Tax=Brassica oleracea var. oleracea TaxID=109376 RepID=A0A0D3DT13_BRAOL
MFDLDEEELTNMIWGDDGETGDHIVPFKVRSEQLKRKEHIDESNKAVKPAEQTLTGTKVEFHDIKLGSSSRHNATDEGIPQTGFCMSSWPDLSLPHARYSSKTGEKTSELWKGPHIFHSTATDESQEEGAFDESGWANIGSFDDLDRMFSNDDVPIFGGGSLSGADELWSSSKDVSNTPSKPLPSVLDSQDLGLDTRAEFEQQENQQFPLTGKANGPSSQCVPSVGVSLRPEQYHEHKGQPSDEDQPYQQDKMKFLKMSGTGTFHDLYGRRTLYRNSPGKFVNQLAPSGSSLIAINLQNASARHSIMTPQEKLEKLRGRQQMQAMLAIQRQFCHQVPLADQYITQNCCQDNPLQLVDTANLQGLTAMPSFDPSSSLEPGDSGNFADGVDSSSEFSVLYRLQDVVAKLDMGTRTCIRDSLFRLADSAGQRQHTSDKTSQDDQEVVIPEKKSRYRYGGMLDRETVTNPTDRTVAHLLFRRPFDMLAAKHMEGGLE